MVLVPVRDDDRLDVARTLAQVGEVRQHQVDPDHLRRGKAQADVDDHDAVVVFDVTPLSVIVRVWSPLTVSTKLLVFDVTYEYELPDGPVDVVPDMYSML